MANYRQIHVSIWKDEWFLDLEPDEKLLFIYLFSNDNTSLAGIYKVALRVIEFETGMDKKRILEIVSKFSKANKLHYKDGVVWVVNMRKYHETKSDKVKIRIDHDIADIPDGDIKKQYIAHYTPDIPYRYPIDTKTQLKEEEEEKEDSSAAKPPNGNFAYREELVKYFMIQTGIPSPRCSTKGEIKTTQKLWWGPIKEIYDNLAQKSMDRAKLIIDKAVVKLRSQGMTISDPNSIIKTARAVCGEASRPLDGISYA